MPNKRTKMMPRSAPLPHHRSHMVLEKAQSWWRRNQNWARSCCTLCALPLHLQFVAMPFTLSAPSFCTHVLFRCCSSAMAVWPHGVLSSSLRTSLKSLHRMRCTAGHGARCIQLSSNGALAHAATDNQSVGTHCSTPSRKRTPTRRTPTTRGSGFVSVTTAGTATLLRSPSFPSKNERTMAPLKTCGGSSRHRKNCG